MDAIGRRGFVKGAAAGALTLGGRGALAFTVGAETVMLTPRQARAQGATYKVLSAPEVETIEALGDILVVDARKAGIANFIDQQLSVPPVECLLEARIMNVRPPYANFYRAACGAVERAVAARHPGQRLAQLTAEEGVAFVNDMRQNKIEGWQGPPGGFVYFLLRSDAADVVYGTMEGYERLGIPYMPHIPPEKTW